jgi:hypothetical protein
MGAGGHGALAKGSTIVMGNYDQMALRAERSNLAQGGHTVHFFELQIHGDETRPLGAAHLNSLLGAGAFAKLLTQALEQLAQQIAHDRVVIHD